MKGVFKGLIAAGLFASAAATLQGSSHREALAILNEPCADNTDTYAWVSDGSHDKLYLIMDFNPSACGYVLGRTSSAIRCHANPR